jgi:hypothetical protein
MKPPRSEHGSFRRRALAGFGAATAALVVPKCGLCLLVYAGLVLGPNVELCGASPTGIPLAWKLSLGVFAAAGAGLWPWCRDRRNKSDG